MSGTSIDGIDAALVAINDGVTRLLQTHSTPYDEALRQDLFALAKGEKDDVHRMATLDRKVGLAFAKATNDLLQIASKDASHIHAIGSHGQTVRHYPTADRDERYSLQIGDPASIAENTGIATVADFRRRDIAAGGEGAPLTPLFHAAQFGTAEECRAIVNIGGISNATLLSGHEVLAGFDCGPGNTLLDSWIRKTRGDDYDAGGAWSGEHTVVPELLESLCADDFFCGRGPSSTGPEHFNLVWLADRLTGKERPGDVQATLAELTAFAIVNSLERCPELPNSLYVCGGGARNIDLMRRLHLRLEQQNIRLGTTDELGLAAEWVEASAFAWLAYRTMHGLPGNSPQVTGAQDERILGTLSHA